MTEISDRKQALPADGWDAAAILRRLSDVEEIPYAALTAAADRRTELTPVFLTEISRLLEDIDPDPDAYTAIFYIVLLLAQWREPAAYRPICELLRLPEAALDAILGLDTFVDVAHRVAASVFDGDPQPLFDVLEDPDLDTILRATLFEALAMVGISGKLDRQTVEKFLADYFANHPPAEEDFSWQGWLAAVAALRLEPLYAQADALFASKALDPHGLNKQDFVNDCAYAQAHPEAPWPPPMDDYHTLWGDTATELKAWSIASEEMEKAAPPAVATQAYTNPYRHVGRNDPCPCGSGQKFKKCCLGKMEESEEDDLPE